MTVTMTMPTAADYRAAFERERVNAYPMVDALEATAGYAIDRERLERAAAVLACPVKTSPPNWQHGRVLYALTRQYLSDSCELCWNLLDIGTAKGFSALCLQWALNDHAGEGTEGVTSVDVIDPLSRVARKTIAEIDGLLTLHETLEPWPEAEAIRFVGTSGVDWVSAYPYRIHVAFVDGSHKGPTVLQEGRLLAKRQEPGDLAIFDDVNRPELLAAVELLQPLYTFQILPVLPTRYYAIGVRR